MTRMMRVSSLGCASGLPTAAITPLRVPPCSTSPVWITLALKRWDRVSPYSKPKPATTVLDAIREDRFDLRSTPKHGLLPPSWAVPASAALRGTSGRLGNPRRGRACCRERSFWCHSRAVRVVQSPWFANSSRRRFASSGGRSGIVRKNSPSRQVDAVFGGESAGILGETRVP